MIYVIEFLVFAFLGWIVDSVYSSLTTKKLVISGYFRGFPFCPIYGFGGILLTNSFALMADQPWFSTILLSTFLVIVLEFFGGFFAEHFLDEKLWDYSDEAFNLYGYISAWHSFLWLVAISILYFLSNEKILKILNWFNTKMRIDPHLDVLLLFAFLMIFIFLTLKNKKIRLNTHK